LAKISDNAGDVRSDIPLRKADGFVSRCIGDDTIIVPVRGGVGDLEAIFTLNPVASTVWDLIDGATSVEGLAAALSRHYEVDQATAAADVAEFVDLLAARGLVATSGATP
jgi:Coenzyme PQQ synthesis protein D (PqqD)